MFFGLNKFYCIVFNDFLYGVFGYCLNGFFGVLDVKEIEESVCQVVVELFIVLNMLVYGEFDIGNVFVLGEYVFLNFIVLIVDDFVKDFGVVFCYLWLFNYFNWIW